MNDIADAPSDTVTITMSIAELVALIAGLMSLNALAIDIMLPALPNIGEAMAVANANHRQWVVIAYVFGMGAAQLLYGPATDRFGRRMPLLVSLIGYAAFGAACIFAPSFNVLVAARALQGVAAAGARVISMSIVRDTHAGFKMARVMSLVTMVFMAVPMLAPNIGQLVLLIAPWRWIFVVLVACGLAMALWVAVRLEETLPPDRRRPLNLGSLLSGYALIFKTRVTCGYILAQGVVFGALFAFIGSSEQLYGDVYGRKETFTLFFASVAAGSAVAAFLNSRLVERFGMRVLAHSAVVCFTLLNIGQIALWLAGVRGFWVFHAFTMLSFLSFSFIGANFNALAMEPLGRIAGTASAAQGFATTMLAGSFGALVGQQFDGTALPVTVGYATLGGLALVIVLITERGRLFGTGPTGA